MDLALLVKIILLENRAFYMENSRNILPDSTFSFVVATDEGIGRLDKFLVSQFSHYSRSFLQDLIARELVSVNGYPQKKPSFPLKINDQVIVTFASAPVIASINKSDTPFDVEVIHTHEHFLIINKPANLIVHTPHKHADEYTLVDWILNRYSEIASVGDADRPGIVHRLDKDTSGIIIIPRTQYAHTTFGKFFEQRKIQKTYLALVQGHPEKQGMIDLPIGRCLQTKTRMATYDPAVYTSAKTRHALTHFTVLEYFNDSALIQVKPVTGRTHQIRVHCAAIGHSIIGDTVYGTTSHFIKRQALHAHEIAFEFDENQHIFVAQLPEDFQKAVEQLRSITI